MSIFIDCLIIAVMALCIFIGYKKGLIKVAISFASIIVSIIIAVLLYKPIAGIIINNTQLDEKISDGIYENIKEFDFNNITEEDREKNQILKISEKYIQEALEKSKENTARYVSSSLTHTLIEVIAFVGLMIVLRIALIILNLLSDVVGNLPIIKQFNKSGGIIYGIIEGLFIVNLAFAILYILNSSFQNSQIQQAIDESKIGKLVYENNIITTLIIKR